MPASRFLKIVKKPAKFQSAVSMCQFLSPGTLLYPWRATADLVRDRVFKVYRLFVIVSSRFIAPCTRWVTVLTQLSCRT